MSNGCCDGSCACHSGGAFRPACDVPGGCGTSPSTPPAAVPLRLVDVDIVAADLHAVIEAWPAMQEALEPGSTQRWTERLDDADQAQARARQDRRERQAREEINAIPPSLRARTQVVDAGYTRAPLAVAALDRITDLAASLIELEDNVREALGLGAAVRHVAVPRPVPPPPAGWHPPLELPPLPAPWVVPGWLVQPAGSLHPTSMGPSVLATRDPLDAARWLSTALSALADHAPDLLAHVATESARCRRLARRARGDVEQVNLIKAPCPICDAMSLRAFPEREVIACVNELCRCTVEDCSCHRGHRHRWLRGDWEWLAQVLDVDLDPSTTSPRRTA